MSVRYEETTSDVKNLAQEIISEYFPELRDVKINYIFDLKKKMSNGKLVLGRCQKTTEILKFFTIDEANDEDGYQYIIYLDKCAWDNIEKEDKARLLRHELRHIFIDNDAKQPYKVVPHDVEDFAEEIELNANDIRWAERVASLTENIYSQRSDDEEED
jgi:hypothetical protein